MPNQPPIICVMSVAAFDATRLPANCRDTATAEFRHAVAEVLRRDFALLKGRLSILVDQRTITVTWQPGVESPDPFKAAAKLLNQGRRAEGIALLEGLLSADPDDPDVLLNLGMALSDKGDLGRAIELLTRKTEVDPDGVNGWTALGVALQRKGDGAAALQALEKAVELEPENIHAIRNLASALGKQGRHAESEAYFRSVFLHKPADVASLYGLALSLWKQGQTEEADRLFKKVIASNPASDIAETARTALRQMAEDRFKEKGKSIGGLRMDAVQYCLWALQTFAKMPKAEVQNIAFEVGMLGAGGLAVDNPAKTYKLKSLPGEHTGLKLVCLMFVGFKQIAPKEDVGFDLQREYEAALALFGKKP